MKIANRVTAASSRLLKYSAAILSAAVGLAILGAPAAATAQTSEVRTGVTPSTFLPFQTPEGSWLYKVSIPGFSFQGIETYDAGGGYTEADQLSFLGPPVASAGHGVWKMTSPNTFLLTYENLTFDSFASGNPAGSLIIRQTTKLSRDGNSYSGAGDYTYFDTNGNPEPSISGTFTITATRIKLSAPQLN